MAKTIYFYHDQAAALDKQYNSIKFKTIHASWENWWPENAFSVLDINAANGSDAKWFAQKRCNFVAFEPADAIRSLGQDQISKEIHWLNDQLPDLSKVTSFSVIVNTRSTPYRIQIPKTLRTESVSPSIPRPKSPPFLSANGIVS